MIFSAILGILVLHLNFDSPALRFDWATMAAGGGFTKLARTYRSVRAGLHKPHKEKENHAP